MSSITAEIRELVEEAKRIGKPVTLKIIWGMLSRDVPEQSVKQTVAIMCGKRQLLKVEPTERTQKGRGAIACFYEPGPEPVTAKERQERPYGMLGNMAHRRLVTARAEARKWKREVWR
jgi:hypothetical protein